MVATRLEGYDLNLIASALDNIKRAVQPNGKVAIQDAGLFTDLKTLIASAVKLGPQLPISVRRNIIHEAVYSVIRQSGISAQTILDEINKTVISYYKRRESKYELVTSISIGRNRHVKNATIAGCLIRFSDGMSKQFREARQSLLDDAQHSVLGALPTEYRLVKVRVSAKSELEAWDRAIDAIDLLRAFWNLALNRRSHMRISSGKRKPVNRFVLGPIHTLHKTTGELATSQWWYQPEYQGPVSAYDPGDIGAEKMFQYADYARERLKSSGYADHLVTCLLRYVRALDTPNWEDSYLRLWGGLEQLTNTGLSDNYKVTIRRASSLWKDRKYDQQILTHLRDYRNNAVHAGVGTQDIETYMYQLKRHVEALIHFHLVNRFRLRTIAEAAEFMDQTDDSEELDKKMRILKAVKAFR